MTREVLLCESGYKTDKQNKKNFNAPWFSKQTTFTLMYYVLFSESLIENWYNPNKLLSLNKDFYYYTRLYHGETKLHFDGMMMTSTLH